VLLGTFFLGYALLNASRTAQNDLVAKYCSRINIRSAPQCAMFTPAPLLRNCLEQRPSNPDNLNSTATGEAGRVYYKEMDLLVTSFLCSSMLFFRLHFKLYTLKTAYRLAMF
jgi:hypothetical protein